MRIEGGHKRGHSNMEHWDTTEAIKDATRKNRRTDDNAAIAADMIELSDLGGVVFGAYDCPLCGLEHEGMCDENHLNDDDLDYISSLTDFYEVFDPWTRQNLDFRP